MYKKIHTVWNDLKLVGSYLDHVDTILFLSPMTKRTPIYHTQNVNWWKGLGKTSTFPLIYLSSRISLFNLAMG